MDVPNPRRILILSPPNSNVPDLLKDLTGSAPSPNPDISSSSSSSSSSTSSLAGLSHNLPLKTAYYSANIPIWIDEIGSAEEWRDEFLRPEAKEVLAVLGAVVLCFRKPVDAGEMEQIKSLLKAVAEVVREGCGYGWDGVCLAVAMSQSVTPHLPLGMEEGEELCREAGFEYIEAEAKGRNDYGEPVGIARIKEALEANDWGGGDGNDFQSDSLGLGSGEEDNDEVGLGAEAAEIRREMFGMREAIYGQSSSQDPEEEDGDDEELKVEELERLMVKVQVIKDMGADMSESERKKFAANAINDLMKTI